MTAAITTAATTLIATTTTTTTATTLTDPVLISVTYTQATSKATTNTFTTTTLTTTTVKNTKTTRTTLIDSKLGIVSKCSLVGAQNIVVNSGKYCVVNKGEKSQSEAYSQCKLLNARLPLPKSEAEMAAFLKVSPNNTWIDIRNAVRGRNL